MADKDTSLGKPALPLTPEGQSLEALAPPAGDEMTARIAEENVRPFSEQFERDLTSLVVPVAIVATFALWSLNFRRAAPVTSFLGTVSTETAGILAGLTNRVKSRLQQKDANTTDVGHIER
jgi:hypothetical protein